MWESEGFSYVGVWSISTNYDVAVGGADFVVLLYGERHLVSVVLNIHNLVFYVEVCTGLLCMVCECFVKSLAVDDQPMFFIAAYGKNRS